MRKAILILGILLLIGGLIGLAVGGIAYGNYSYNSHQIASGNALDNATNQALLSAQFGDAIGGIIGGIIFVVIGLVLVIVGFKGKSKKEKMAEHGQNKA